MKNVWANTKRVKAAKARGEAAAQRRETLDKRKRQAAEAAATAKRHGS